jgi:hypothetical protein
MDSSVVLPRPRPAEIPALVVTRSVSLTSGSDAALSGIRQAPAGCSLRCHRFDEPIVQLLVRHAGRSDCRVEVADGETHGTLRVTVELLDAPLAVAPSPTREAPAAPAV